MKKQTERHPIIVVVSAFLFWITALDENAFGAGLASYLDNDYARDQRISRALEDCQLVLKGPAGKLVAQLRSEAAHADSRSTQIALIEKADSLSSKSAQRFLCITGSFDYVANAVSEESGSSVHTEADVRRFLDNLTDAGLKKFQHAIIDYAAPHEGRDATQLIDFTYTDNSLFRELRNYRNQSEQSASQQPTNADAFRPQKPQVCHARSSSGDWHAVPCS